MLYLESSFQAILKINEWLGPLFPPEPTEATGEATEATGEATEEQKKKLFVDDDVVIETK